MITKFKANVIKVVIQVVITYGGKLFGMLATQYKPIQQVVDAATRRLAKCEKSAAMVKFRQELSLTGLNIKTTVVRNSAFEKWLSLRTCENVAVEAEKGVNILELAHENDIDLEELISFLLKIEGACECSCACSTCHVILEDSLYDKLEEPSDEELDMLDLAFGLTETSRLGCQIIVNDDFAGAKIKLPAATRNFYVDGAKPIKH
ncbi:hypothetical protein BB561_002997 [Smittium simulii]|uniref:2Fe-2S ferredoxin n=1 Tax=Smittium simulii TaxID=133385 RepID=A0A2T9YNC7_9FUNG|nr:hypothetical protein BB561_002997 [Smittium simulii]